MSDSFSTLVTGPATALISLADVKQHAVGVDDDDALLQSYVAAAAGWMDGEAGVLGRALITQTWKLTLSRVPRGRDLRLPIPTVQSVASITYFDTDGTTQTFAADQYRLVSTDQFGLVELVDTADWPAVQQRADAMSVEYVTGYGDAPSDVPAPIRQAAALLAAHWYEQRVAVDVGNITSVMPMGVQMLLSNYRLARGHI